MLACAASGFAQRTVRPVESDIHKQEREADLMAKRQRDLMHLNDKIAITYERDALGQYIFSCRNNTFCNYVVELSFPDLENLRSDMPLPYKVDIPPAQRPISTNSIPWPKSLATRPSPSNPKAGMASTSVSMAGIPFMQPAGAA